MESTYNYTKYGVIKYVPCLVFTYDSLYSAEKPSAYLMYAVTFSAFVPLRYYNLPAFLRTFLGTAGYYCYTD